MLVRSYFEVRLSSNGADIERLRWWARNRHIYICILYIYIWWNDTASRDLTPKCSCRREIPLFQGKLGWWNIVISSDFWTIYVLYTYIVWVWPPFSRLQSSPEWHCIHLGNRWFCWLNRLICHDCLPGMGHTQYVITRNKWLKIHALLGLQHLQPYFWGL